MSEISKMAFPPSSLSQSVAEPAAPEQRDSLYASRMVASDCPSINLSKQSQARNPATTRAVGSDGNQNELDRGSSCRSLPETAVIFDWDDTLLPSSFVTNPREPFAEKLAAARLLQTQVLKLLGRALSLSHRYVFILTSSGPGWVQQSCMLYYPQVLPLLSKVTIVHADEFCREFAMVNLQFRQYCNSGYCRSPKLASVLAILPALQPEPQRVVLIGDQYADVSIAEALRQRGGDIRTCLFAVEPTARELGRELEWLLDGDMFGRLCLDNELRQRNFALKRSSGTSERSTEDGGSERSSSFSSETDHLGEDSSIGCDALKREAEHIDEGKSRRCVSTGVTEEVHRGEGLP